MRLTNLKINQNNNNFRMNLTDICKIKREFKRKSINRQSKLDNLMTLQMKKIKYIIKRGQD